MSQPVSIRPADGSIDWSAALARLDRLLRVRTTPIGMKMFETVEEMEAVEKIRRPKDIHTADQIVSMASRLNWTVGITGSDLVGTQCQAGQRGRRVQRMERDLPHHASTRQCRHLGNIPARH